MKKEKTNSPLLGLVKKYEATNDKLNIEDRFRYAIAQTMCYGKEVNTPDMKKIRMTLVEPKEQTAGQLKTKLVKMFVLRFFFLRFFVIFHSKILRFVEYPLLLKNKNPLRIKKETASRFLFGYHDNNTQVSKSKTNVTKNN